MAEKSKSEDSNSNWHATLLNGWMTTKLEFDKSLLTLSAAGVGLAVTLLTTGGPNTRLIVAGYGFSVLAFLASMGFVMKIFLHNANILQGLMTTGVETKALKLDRWAIGFFIVGVILLFAIGADSALSKVNQGAR